MLILKSQKVNKGAKPPKIFGKTGKGGDNDAST